jgi:lambda family phage tail tape measure protein
LAKQREVINQALVKERDNINSVTRAYREQAAEFNRKFAFQTRLLRLTDEQRLVEETMADAQQEYLSQIEPLLRRIQEIKASGNAADLEILPVLKQGIADITAEYNAQLPVLKQLLDSRLEQMAIQKEMLRMEELATAAAERRAAVEDEVQKIIVNGTKRIRDAYDQVQLEGLTGIARELKRIEIEERNLAEAARERVAAQFGDNDPEGLGRAMDEIKRASDEIVRRRQAAMRAIMQEQRTFSAGWRKAWEEYRDAASNASKTAETVFRKTTQGMEDALVNFAKTGRFEWKSFVADILEELLRSNIRELLASLGTAFNIGGLFGGSGGGQSRGASPTNPLYVIDIAGGGATGGGTGGNLLGSIFGGGQPARTPGINPNAGGGSSGGLLGTVGNVLGSIGSGIGTAVKTVASGIGSAVSGVIGGIKNIFGGFFATGGTLPRGKIGVVGERGPELIRGPGDITPLSMGGGSTNVTYNINAVDARSFQQLLAQDPSLIFALTEQGRKTVAGTRR